MPTYEYKCESCSKTFEEIQSMTDDPLTTCPKCGGKVQRLISSGVGLIFKGSGFYLTDYKKSSASPAGSNGESKPKTKAPAEKPAVAKTKSTKKSD
ncbi:MAG TPA: FmdB family zinc ribbon protein [Candidatus Kryptonia bacterium]